MSQSLICQAKYVGIWIVGCRERSVAIITPSRAPARLRTAKSSLECQARSATTATISSSWLADWLRNAARKVRNLLKKAMWEPCVEQVYLCFANSRKAHPG